MSHLNQTLNKMIEGYKLLDGSCEESKKRSMSSSNSSLDEGTPMKRPKYESLLDESYLGSPREVRRIRADLLQARNEILNLENRITQLHCARKQMELIFEDETKTLKRTHEYDKKTISELEAQLQSIRKREIELKAEVIELRSKMDMSRVKSDEKINDLEREIAELKDQLQESKFDDQSELNSLKRRISELESILEAAESNAEAQRNLVEEVSKELSKKNHLERELEQKEQALQKARMQIKEMEYSKENYLEFQKQAKTQAQKIANYIEMQKENERLKEENVRLKDEVKNKLLLEEEVNDLKSRLISFKETEKKFAALQVQQVQNEMYLNEWRAVARGICESLETESALPHSLRREVEKLQQQEINLTAEKVELESKLKIALHEAKVAKGELERNQQLLEQQNLNKDQKQKLIHRMQKKLLLVSKERDSYRLQLDSYEKDLTMSNITISGNSSNQVQSQKERIKNLEKIIEEYKDLVAKFENDLQQAQPEAYEDNSSFTSKLCDRLKQQVDQLRLENDRLRQRKDDLEIQLETQLQSANSKASVFHLQNNPLSECLAQRSALIETLEQEVQRLKRKIKNMEEGIDSSKLDMTVCPEKFKALEEKLQSKEVQMQRLKETIKTSMEDFRTVIYILLGYEVNKTNSIYKLRSMYAENEEDQLCFRINEEGLMDLLENEYSAKLEDMIKLHLGHQKSYPVFLSAVTMDLFASRTRVL